LPEGAVTSGIVSWIIQGGVVTALMTWLGVQQRQIANIQTHQENVRNQERRARDKEMHDIRQTISANARAISTLREEAVTKDDLNRVADRLESYMQDGFTEVRREVSGVHSRVDNVVVGGKRRTDPPES